MAPKLLHMLLLVAVASARTIDIHIAEDGTITSNPLRGTECLLRESHFCDAKCEDGEEECYANPCGLRGCCIKGSMQKLCCTGGCPQLNSLEPPKVSPEPQISHVVEEKHKDIVVPAPISDAQNCHWEGTAPSCVTGCGRGRLCGVDNCGDGACCWTGLKSYCCDSCPNSLPFPALPVTQAEHTKDQHVIEDKKQDVVVQAPLAGTGNCHWEGTAPSCVTGCGRGRLCGVDACGDGSCCWTGWKSWCCDSCPNSAPFGEHSLDL